MLKHIVATVAMFSLFMVGMEMTVGPAGRFTWLPISAVREFYDISPVVNLFPVFLLIPYFLLLTAGLLSLLELD